jgi:hypothetical protein
VSQELSLEDILKAFRQTVNQPFHEIIDTTMTNTEAIAWLEGQLSHLIAKFNIVEEEELQSQEMARGQYMIDEDGSNSSYHEHVQATTRGSEEIVDETVSELSLEDPEVECFTQDENDLNFDRLLGQARILCEPNIEDPEVECFAQFDLDLDKFLEQGKTFDEPSLEEPLEESFSQFEFDLDLDMICEQAKPLLDSTPKVQTEKRETTKISFPNSSSLVAEPFIMDNCCANLMYLQAHESCAI